MGQKKRQKYKNKKLKCRKVNKHQHHWSVVYRLKLSNTWQHIAPGGKCQVFVSNCQVVVSKYQGVLSKCQWVVSKRQVVISKRQVAVSKRQVVVSKR